MSNSVHTSANLIRKLAKTEENICECYVTNHLVIVGLAGPAGHTAVIRVSTENQLIQSASFIFQFLSVFKLQASECDCTQHIFVINKQIKTQIISSVS